MVYRLISASEGYDLTVDEMLSAASGINADCLLLVILATRLGLLVVVVITMFRVDGFAVAILLVHLEIRLDQRFTLAVLARR